VPELPEVETVVREIQPALLNRRIVRAKFSVSRQLQPQTPRSVAQAVKNRTICDVQRRGKYIVLQLDRGVLLIHLRMTGRLYVRATSVRPWEHERAWFELDNSYVLAFRDSRTLGTIRLLPDPDAVENFIHIGWEPLRDRVTYADVKPVLARRTIAIKPLLLDQGVWAGIGNIYASEILWETKINPHRKASSLKRAEIERLLEWIPRVLERAIEKGGSTLRNFVGADGNVGSYQCEFRVYDREHEPCLRCGARIRRVVQAQRSTYFCPRCQKKL
jgi:formamidopyrimidine-DNA glycosylase